MIRRKNYFIKKKFQLHFSFRFIALLLIEAALIAGLFIYISNNTLTTGYSGSTLTIKTTSQFFIVQLLLIILITVIGMGIAGMITFILLSHRIAGPLYRFESDLKQMVCGDLTKRINLRKTDQLTDLKESLNALIDCMDERLGRAKSVLSRLNELSKSGKEDPASIAEMRRAIELLHDEIGRFKVTAEKRKA